MWKKDDWVVVIGGTFDKSDGLKGVSFTIARILEIGLDDLLVKPNQKQHWEKRAFFVPKSRCKYIPIDLPDVYESIRRPQIGDLVLYYYNSYSGKLTKEVAHVLELKHGTADAVEALITVSDKHQWVSVDNLLVLDVNKEIE